MGEESSVRRAMAAPIYIIILAITPGGDAMIDSDEDSGADADLESPNFRTF